MVKCWSFLFYIGIANQNVLGRHIFQASITQHIGLKASRDCAPSALLIRGGETEIFEEEYLPQHSLPETINVAVSTGAGTRFLDQRCQLLLPGTATVADLKAAVREKLAAQPPVCVQSYFYQTQALEDHQILGELLVEVPVMNPEEGKSANKDEESSKKVNVATTPAISLLLDMVPPVKGPDDVDDPACSVPSETKEKIKAYAANAAGLQYATRAYFRYMAKRSNTDLQSEFLSIQLRDDIALLEEFAEDLEVSELPKDPDSYIIPLSHRNGTALDRFRIGFSQQLNIDWIDSMRLMFLLFLFSFGAIGAGKPILKMMIPGVIIVQLRMFKFFSKILRYSLPNIPALSEFVGAHLPVTHLLLLTFDDETYVQELYKDNSLKDPDESTEEGLKGKLST